MAAIVSGDIKFRLSTTVGNTGSQLVQSDVNQSLGKNISRTDIVDATLNNLFDDISGDENAASTIDYRCFFVLNTNPTNTLISPVVLISAFTSGGASGAIGVDGFAATFSGILGPQAVQIANELTAPTGIVFSRPLSKATGLPLGNIPPSACKAIWVKRMATNSAAVNNDGLTIRVEGDTQA